MPCFDAFCIEIGRFTEGASLITEKGDFLK